MPELATLRIYRPVRLTNAVGAMVIEMDGRELTRLWIGQNWASHVEPGQHVLRIRQWWVRSNSSLELMLAPGDDVRLETRISPWTGKHSFVQKDGGTTGPPVRPSAPPPAIQVLVVTETHRSEEPIGTETRLDRQHIRHRPPDPDHPGHRRVEPHGQPGPARKP